MNYALFTPLVQYDEDLDVQPWLAESWEMHGDTAVVFRLRQDVRWHDGQPVTAHDVEFTFNLAKDEETASLLGRRSWRGRERRGDRRLTPSVPLRSPARAGARGLLVAAPAAAPARGRFARRTAQRAVQPPAGRQRPVPLRRVAGQRAAGAGAQPDFPEALGGPAAAERIVFRVIPEASTMLTELLTGSVHVDIPLMPDQVRQVRDNAETELHSFPGRTVYYLGWNNERAPFNDVRVRRALALAVDRDEIVEALLYGEGTVATSTIPPWHPLYPGIDPLAHDPRAGGRLLEEAGWATATMTASARTRRASRCRSRC
jgi:peptide/nickel transport system substrate-binding protein